MVQYSLAIVLPYTQYSLIQISQLVLGIIQIPQILSRNPRRTGQNITLTIADIPFRLFTINSFDPLSFLVYCSMNSNPLVSRCNSYWLFRQTVIFYHQSILILKRCLIQLSSLTSSFLKAVVRFQIQLSFIERVAVASKRKKFKAKVEQYLILSILIYQILRLHSQQ